jgi:DNA-binding CsgD family transcriptional regulator
MTADNRRADEELIGIAAGRIRRFAEAISQGHDFGIEAGDHHEPWTFGFHRVAVDIYKLTLPWAYLTGLASAFEDCADRMLTDELPPGTTLDDWSLVHDYLRSAANAITEASELTIDPDELPTAEDIDPVTPPVMSFGKLAAIVSAAGAQRLAAAAGSVEHSCGEADTCPLSEAELDWLRRIRRGDRIIDIAVDHGYSERSLYRALAELYDELSVETRTEAIAVAAENGWI